MFRNNEGVFAGKILEPALCGAAPLPPGEFVVVSRSQIYDNLPKPGCIGISTDFRYLVQIGTFESCHKFRVLQHDHEMVVRGISLRKRSVHDSGRPVRSIRREWDKTISQIMKILRVLLAGVKVSFTKLLQYRLPFHVKNCRKAAISPFSGILTPGHMVLNSFQT